MDAPQLPTEEPVNDGPCLSLPTIGWREWVGLPELGVAAIKCKIDTGARSSALHAFDVEFFERGGVRMVRFNIHPRQRDSELEIPTVARLLEFRKVKSSGGHETRRPVIVTPIEVLGQRFEIELTLASRDTMGFRMLLGREAVRNRFLVHPGRSYFGGKPAAKVKRRKRRRGEQQ